MAITENDPMKSDVCTRWSELALSAVNICLLLMHSLFAIPTMSNDSIDISYCCYHFLFVCLISSHPSVSEIVISRLELLGGGACTL